MAVPVCCVVAAPQGLPPPPSSSKSAAFHLRRCIYRQLCRLQRDWRGTVTEKFVCSIGQGVSNVFVSEVSKVCPDSQIWWGFYRTVVPFKLFFKSIGTSHPDCLQTQGQRLHYGPGKNVHRDGWRCLVTLFSSFQRHDFSTTSSAAVLLLISSMISGSVWWVKYC